MKITIESKAGTVKSGNVREFRKHPSDLNLAAQAAAHYANKLGERMVVIDGNSYMRFVYHIARESDPVTKFKVVSGQYKVVIVEPSGECFYGIAE